MDLKTMIDTAITPALALLPARMDTPAARVLEACHLIQLLRAIPARFFF